MAGRSVWKGFVRFGLVSIPVKAYSATESSGSITLNQIHRGCGARIRYKKTCPEHGEVEQGDIVSGYQHAPDQYVIIDTNELEKLRTPQEKAVDITAFIEPATIDPVYYSGRTMYLVPDGAPGFKPYALLTKVMAAQDRYAFAKVVMSGKDQIVILRAIDGMLVMTFLNFASEIRPTSQYADEVRDTSPSAEELKMARVLTEAMEAQDFDFASHKNNYNERLTELIQDKIAGKEIVTPPSEELRPVPDLMAALRASIEGKKATVKKRPAKLAAPSKPREDAARRRKTS